MQLLYTFNKWEKWCVETSPKVTQKVESGFEPRKSGLKPAHFNYCTKDWWSPPPLGSSQYHLWLVTLSGSPGGNSCQAHCHHRKGHPLLRHGPAAGTTLSRCPAGEVFVVGSDFHHHLLSRLLQMKGGFGNPLLPTSFLGPSSCLHLW